MASAGETTTAGPPPEALPAPLHGAGRLTWWRRLPGALAGAVRSLRARAPWAVHLPLAVVALWYVVHFGTIAVAMLHSFGQPAYDMAEPDQGIWLLSRFHDPYLTVAGRNLFGDHPSFIYLTLVPVYWLYPHTSSLLVVQVMLQAGAAVPVYLLAEHLLKRWSLATLFALAYLLNPALQQTALEQFHVEAFETFLLAWAIYWAVRWRPRLFLACLALVLMCKEDAALYTAPLAIWALLRRDRRAGAVGLVASAAVAGFDNLFLVPTLIGYASAHGGRIPFGGFGGLFSTTINRPGRLVDYLTSSPRPWYLWQMGASSGLAFLASPEIAAVGVLQLAVNLISNDAYQQQILYHYSMPLAAVLTCGSVYAVSRLRTGPRRLAVTVMVAASALWSCVLWGAAPFSRAPALAPADNTPRLVADHRLLSQIPPTASVSAVQELVPALDHRVSIYMWPNPFHQVYYGNPRFDGTDWPYSSRVQYLVLPACLSCDQGSAPWTATFARISHQFRAVARTADYVVYKRLSEPVPAGAGTGR